MANVKIKIVGVEGDAVLVKFASDNSAKPIDEYDAQAYQPKLMGVATKEAFLAEIKSGLALQVARRDSAESSADIDLNSWVGHESVETVVEPEPTTIIGNIPAVLDTTNEVTL